MHDIRNTEVFRHARRLVRLVYVETRGFPEEEMYGLTSQMRRSANSIGANLMEGSGRNTIPQFRHFVGNATGSTYELEWHTLIAGDLTYLPPANRDALLAEIVSMKKLLYRFRQSLQ